MADKFKRHQYITGLFSLVGVATGRGSASVRFSTTIVLLLGDDLLNVLVCEKN